ncbi:MAG: hypothetical protein J6N72_00625 [Psychrobacter sp.]|nr:hypothetical protein [Psychrobacter sp.]
MNTMSFLALEPINLEKLASMSQSELTIRSNRIKEHTETLSRRIEDIKDEMTSARMDEKLAGLELDIKHLILKNSLKIPEKQTNNSTEQQIETKAADLDHLVLRRKTELMFIHIETAKRQLDRFDHQIESIQTILGSDVAFDQNFSSIVSRYRSLVETVIQIENKKNDVKPELELIILERKAIANVLTKRMISIRRKQELLLVAVIISVLALYYFNSI